ncbi:ubiquitin carboxyl-terminal hydrolase 42-like [Aquila chrysaetos chrysaetos]|uniref:ubiquitin carboxyl-terminal hydrolase 42-like n=1 Tax=Aquila chrysaetos chrysaetos TaxID=223781 RepID=UPI001176EB53|nr:ubiquitin carboxyl-terminal hydrolase 42-like [Aquila chrysaetos chrysaetos]
MLRLSGLSIIWGVRGLCGCSDSQFRDDRQTVLCRPPGLLLLHGLLQGPYDFPPQPEDIVSSASALVRLSHTSGWRISTGWSMSPICKSLASARVKSLGLQSIPHCLGNCDTTFTRASILLVGPGPGASSPPGWSCRSGRRSPDSRRLSRVSAPLVAFVGVATWFRNGTATDPSCKVVAEGMAPPQRILFPPENIYMDWQQRWRAGAGLHNSGNTCFLNSVLQCLTYTPPPANYLLSREHSRSCRQQGFCVMCRMENHVNTVLRSSGRAIYPSAVISVLTLIGEHFQLGMQEDAHEFLRYAIDAMQRACLSGISDLDTSSESTTIIHQIFGGFLRSRVTCSSCKVASDSYEAFLDIPLDIKAVSSVTAALTDFVKPEQLDGENCFTCSQCNKKVAASKRFTIHRAPKVLPVCLKRFEDFTGGKIDKVVKYSNCLDLRPYMSQTDGEPLFYSLYAVLVHSGNSCDSGHYFCYTKVKSNFLPHTRKTCAEEDKL